MPANNLRLLPPEPISTAAIALDESQSAAFSAARTADALLVVGAPGTGKTTLVEQIALAAINDWGLAPDRVLVLAATRRAAGELRDRIGYASRATATTPLVRTPASLAVAILAARAAALGDSAPSFVAGPEQDRDLADIISGRLADLDSDDSLPPGWTPELMGLRGFRDELRDLLMRVAEWGLEPSALADLGRAYDRPEWVYAADIYTEYRAINRLRALTPGGGTRLDPGVVINEATKALTAWAQQTSGSKPPSFDLVIVDDYQEATLATAGLLTSLHQAGTRLVLVGDPDTAVQTFRGASPMLIGRAEMPSGTEVGAFGAQACRLSTNWRQPAQLWELAKLVEDQIPTVGGPLHRQVGLGRAAEPGSRLVARAFSSTAEECAWIARELRSAHLLRGLAWDRMAVVARSGGKLAELRRALAASGVPISVRSSAVPLRAEPAVAPLLELFRYCLAPEELTAEAVADLLVSPIGGLDPLSLRRLRRQLRAGDATRTSDELLLTAVQEPIPDPSAPVDDEATPTSSSPPGALARLQRILAAGRTAAIAEGANAQMLLWAIWAASEVSEQWRDVAIAGGPAGSRADHDLDSVVALFRAAEVFVERNPGAPPMSFLEFLAGQDLPADSLAATAYGLPTVAAVTPVAAAGQEWDLVIVAGVQEGAWPNLRLRDSVFGAFALTELLAGRSSAAKIDERAARKQVLADELRSFLVALTRARETLMITAVSNSEEQPSAFFELAAGTCQANAAEAPAPAPAAPAASTRHSAAVPSSRHSAAGVPSRHSAAAKQSAESRPFPRPAIGSLDFSAISMDLPGVVAAARKIVLDALDQPEADQDEAQTEALAVAVKLLAELADRHVAAADPNNWYGVAEPSSDEPLWSSQQQVPISASRLELIGKCPLRWAFESAGATAGGAAPQNLGILIHSIAEARPVGSKDEYLADLDRRWTELELPDNWLSRRLRESAEEMIGRLAQFVADNPDYLEVEQGFSAEIGRAELRGKVDRIDAVRNLDGTTSALITDFKTSGNPISRAEQDTNPQLAAYQLAISSSPSLQATLSRTAGAPVESAGARLVYLGGDTKGPTIRTQSPLTDEVSPATPGETSRLAWARDLVESAAQAISGHRFAARENDWCRHCPVSNSCPLRELV